MQNKITYFLVASLAFALGAFTTYYFIETRDDGNESTCPTCDYSTAPEFKSLSLASAHKLAKLYKDECQPALTALMPEGAIRPDARSVHFYISDLKKFIWDIESKLCGCDNFKDLGIRFYYAKYPDLNTLSPEDSDLADIPKEFSFHHTLFMVPTFKGKNGINQDFEPSGIQDCIIGKAASERTTIMNHGNITPPPFGASETPASFGMSY